MNFMPINYRKVSVISLILIGLVITLPFLRFDEWSLVFRGGSVLCVLLSAAAVFYRRRFSQTLAKIPLLLLLVLIVLTLVPDSDLQRNAELAFSTAQMWLRIIFLSVWILGTIWALDRTERNGQ